MCICRFLCKCRLKYLTDLFKLPPCLVLCSPVANIYLVSSACTSRLISLLAKDQPSELSLNFNCKRKQCNMVRHYHCRLPSSGNLTMRQGVISNMFRDNAVVSSLTLKMSVIIASCTTKLSPNIGHQLSSWCHISEEWRPQVQRREGQT